MYIEPLLEILPTFGNFGISGNPLSFSPLQLCPQYVKKRASGELEQLHIVFRLPAAHQIVFPQGRPHLPINGKKSLLSGYHDSRLNNGGVFHHQRPVREGV
jgi:hypothetical protein